MARPKLSFWVCDFFITREYRRVRTRSRVLHGEYVAGYGPIKASGWERDRFVLHI